VGEIFDHPKPGTPLSFSGERLTSELGGQTEIEHLHRYLLARDFCRGKDVLDIASGEGYGSAILAQVAASVIGVDVSAEAAAHAAANYASDRLRFLQGSALAIPIDSFSIDIVVSFETIEHFDGHDRFLSEIKRVLRPGGRLIISTPDRDNYSPVDQPANPFHVLEMTRDEFADLLGGHFAHVAVSWQRAVYGSVLIPGTGVPIANDALTFERRGSAHFEMSTGYPRPQYLVAVCSDLAAQPFPVSVYIDTSQLSQRELELRKVLAEEQDRIRAAEADAYNATLRAEAAESLGSQVTQRAEAAELLSRDLQGQLESSRRDIAELLASTSWRLTAPLRWARRRISR